MSGKRDYKAEYRRRIERAAARGLSRSQARGHARSGEAPVRAKPAKRLAQDDGLENALKILRQSGLQGYAAKHSGVSVERFRRFLRENDLAKRIGAKWQITDQRPRQITAFVDGQALSLTVPGFEAASIIGQHNAAVKQFIETNEPAHLLPFEGLTVADSSGASHTLETDPNTLYRLAASGSEVFEQVYRLII